ncbi:histidine kinase [Gemmatimonadetes bacterium T265]|nr:histidine kinase [Gemmatimonadetes bacterium T265]
MTTPAAPRPPAAADDALDDVLKAVFPGDSEMAARCRAFDWAATPLGPVDGWPSSLRTAVGVCLAAPGPMALSWGPELVLVYNDAYRAVLGAAKHPGALGRPTREVWAEVWDQLAPDFARVMAGGPVPAYEDQRFVLRRDGRDEEAFFSYAFVPVRDEANRVGGGLHVLTETTGRVRAEAALRVERERLALLVLAMPAPVALHWGSEHRLAVVNAAFRRISGGRDFTGLTPREAYPELAGQGILERFDEVVASGAAWVAPETPVRYDQSGLGPEDLWFDLRYEPVRDVDGRVVGVLNFSIDVTDQVRARREVERLLAESEAARAALAESEARFRTVQDASPLGFAIHRPVYGPDGAVVDFTIPYVNAAGARIVGQPRAQLLAGTVLGIWPGTGPDGVFADYVRVLETGEPGYREVLYEHDELVAGLTLTVVRIGDATGGPGADAEIGITFTDVTARLRAEQERARLLAELEAERERLRSVVLHMPAPLALLEGPEHRFTLVNEAFKRVSGGGRDVTGLVPAEAFPELAGSGMFDLHDRVYQTGEPWVGPETLVRYDRDGAGVQDTWFDLRFEPVRDAGGHVVAILNFAVDVTEQVGARRRVERLLAESQAARADAENARRAAEAATRARSDFLSTMSHELRTPLNAIGGYAELLALGITGPVTDAQRQQLERIQASQRHLLGLVNEVLDLSKIDAGAVSVERAPVAVAGTTDAALALVRPQAAAKDLALTEACDAPADVHYLGDEPRVRQVLVNLLANAVKFTPAGGRVALTCAVGEAAAAGGPYLALRVADTGVGIAPDQRERIFEPFTQAGAGTNPYTRAVGGTGLGLTISRRLARLMGGDLTVESTPGAGSTFTLWLPMAERRAQPRPPTPAAGAPAVRAPAAGAPAAGAPADRPPAVGAPGGGRAAPDGGDDARDPLGAADPALARLGDALLAAAGPVVRAWAARLRADPAIPTAAPNGRPRTDAELEDHAATFVTDVALALRTLAAGGPDTPALLRDGTAILATVAERHGAQRARLRWPAAAVARELVLLGEELDAALGRAAQSGAGAGEGAGESAREGAALARARDAVARLIARATRVSLGGHRLAPPDAPVSA